MVKGFAAEETKAALAREAELAADAGNFSARFTAFLGQFRVACTAGELRSARELALTLLREAEETGELEEAATVANNVLGLTAYWQADFVEARPAVRRRLLLAAPAPIRWRTVGEFGALLQRLSSP